MNKLGRKQSIDNKQWIDVAAHIKEYISLNEINSLAKKTIEEIENAMKEYGKSAYAWSGGKDSLVLGELCQKAGITNCVLGICDLEYPAFMRWISEHKPENLTIINTGQDIAWLAKHPEMLFPDNKKAARWFSIIQHKAQTQYYKENNLNILLLGRRKADGNFVGRNTNIYTAKGITRYSPLSDWSHEEILAYIVWNEISIPPIYGWPNGYKCGTHPWPARQHVVDEQTGWKEIFEIDPTIVEAAASVLSSARLFLDIQ